MRPSGGMQRSVRDFFAATTAKRPAEAAGAPASPAKKRVAGVAVTAEATTGGAPASAPLPPPRPSPAKATATAAAPPLDPAAAKATAASATALVARRVAAADGNGLHPSLADLLVEGGWSAALAPVLTPRTVAPLQRFLESEWSSKSPIYPPRHLIFRALNEVPLAAVRVVIIGQDPYHGPGQAEGLSFSVPRGQAVPPSLRNIHKELADDIPTALPPSGRPAHGSLAAWAGQGVLLLNATLTVRGGAANSHAGKGWEAVTDAAIRAVASRTEHTVFLLWGKFAQAKAGLVRAGGGGRHTILEAPHPSGLSAHRGFFGCRHFSKANAALVAAGGEPIDWRV